MTENFIFTDYIEDLSLCDKIIDYFHKTENKMKGGTGLGLINENVKKSTDASLLENHDLSKQYMDQLKKITDKYIEKYTFSNYYNPFNLQNSINIQHYKPTEGYYGWHTERVGAAEPGVFRHLVYMTYLNDVTDDGETEFYYQQIKIQPKRGLTVIWPADWTHTHRGIASQTQDKYIVTGWYVYTS